MILTEQQKKIVAETMQNEAFVNVLEMVMTEDEILPDNLASMKNDDLGELVKSNILAKSYVRNRLAFLKMQDIPVESKSHIVPK